MEKEDKTDEKAKAKTEEKPKKKSNTAPEENKGSPKRKNVIDTSPTLDEEFENLELFEDDDEELDEALSMTGRRKLARSARKNRRKLKFARKKRSRRKADKNRLKGRSRKSAVKTMRNKVAGKKGKKYSDLSHSAKSVIDKRVSKRKKQVDRIARKDMPNQRRKDIKRIRREGYDINQEFENVLEEGKFHELLTKDGKPKIDGRFKIFKTKNKRSSDTQDSLGHLAKKVAESIDLEEAKTRSYLKKKAKELGESYNLLQEIYDQGLDEWTSYDTVEPAQFAMNKVYAYINERFGESKAEKRLRTALDMLAKLVKAAPHESITSHAFTVTRQLNMKRRPRELAKIFKDLTTSGAIPVKKDRSALYKKYGFTYTEANHLNEVGGAGQEGTDKLTKRFKKDTPGECGCEGECECDDIV